MPNWSDLLAEVKAAGSTHDQIRRRYLANLSEYTGRNTITYYSGWLQKGELQRQIGTGAFSVNDDDKNSFMATIHELDRSKGLDLLLHTPGGEIAATESLVDYLRSMFGTDIRAFIPQLAMSAGTMIALSCRQVIMGKHSSLGPIDPQIGGIAAHGIVEEFNRAIEDIQKNQLLIHMWQPIIAKYHPTLIGECEKAISWAEEMVRDWLRTGMFAEADDADAKAASIVQELGDHALTKTHSRHISAKRAQELGIDVLALEDDGTLQDLVLSVHHASIQTLSATPALKIVENQNGVAYISSAAQIALIGGALPGALGDIG